jgi:carbamoyl-phosphate synthase large subunit
MAAVTADAPCVLITAAGTGTAYGYALALAQFQPQVRLVTADTNPRSLVSAAGFADAHHQVPAFGADAGFLDHLVTLMRQEGVTHYLPIIDPEIAYAAEHSAGLPAQVLAPLAAAVAVEKQHFPQRLGALGLDTPQIFGRDRLADRLPCYAKRPAGFGGRACWPVQGPDDLAQLPADAFLQEWVTGREYTADCFATGDSDFAFVSVRERLEVKSGVCTKARIAPHAGMEEAARRLVTGLGMSGAFCFQAIETESGRLAVTDINPRLGAGSAMSGANGSDFFAAHWAGAFGGEPRQHLRRLRVRCHVTRQYVEFLGSE